MIKIDKNEFLYSVKATEITNPIWQNKVERWYQLDEASKTLCQMIYEWKNCFSGDVNQAQAIIYLFSKGSNQSDIAFVKGHMLSPSQFVYTLPNVPISMAQQMLSICKATYCFNVIDVFNLNENENLIIRNFLKVFEKRQQPIMVVFQQKNSLKNQWDFKVLWL